MMVGRVGVEPTPSGLKVRRSTSELTARVTDGVEHWPQFTRHVFSTPIHADSVVAPNEHGLSGATRERYRTASGAAFTSGSAKGHSHIELTSPPSFSADPLGVLSTGRNLYRFGGSNPVGSLA
jgi:hypothetical protein